MGTAPMKNFWGVLVLLPLAACEGVINTPGQSSGGALPAPEVRRLTRAEIDATLTDALGQQTNLAAVLAAEDMVNGYTGHDDLLVSTLFADQLDSATAALATQVAPAQQQTLNCGASEAETDCVKRYLSTFAARAWRRPVTDDELNDLVALYSAGRDGEDIPTGLALAIQGVMEASGFLYRTELGADGAAGPTVDLTQYEIAAELSYLATGGPPDDTLRAAAASNALSDPKARSTQLERLLATPTATLRLRLFTEEWLGLTNIRSIQKDNNVFPKFDTDLRDAIAGSAEAFIDAVMSSSKGSVPELLSADYTYADDSVASFIGATDMPGMTPARISTTALPRRGLITHPALLGTYAHPDQGSPTLRGKLVRTRLLCQDIPPPPPNVIASVGPVDPNATTRQHYEGHVSNDTCNTCHKLMDPIGFGLEGFDGFGEFRTTEAGQNIDDHGNIDGSDIAGTFQGGVQLANKLAMSTQVGNCAATQLTRFALGHLESSADSATLTGVKQAYQASSGSLHAAMGGLVESDAFAKRSVSP
jgi:hypothetical protein